MPSTLKRCESCNDSYAANHFRASSTCILCQLQLKQEESDRRHDETSKMYDDLAQKFSNLQDFVASNVGCAPEEALTYATVAAAPHPAT
ncbi:hypothetical protein Pcinc_004493 [Petrolisthes cinctipes]|uniref:Uncharacterized protein n=1 Tax=Petrolisthes cinctipes TaxID=88211 RepID=A0AAE1GGQ9_PETCI|nr:hypothetical protein Pcinc_004493 [Petrolisthes cinctipes]